MDLCDEKKFIKLDDEVVINRDRRGDVRGFIRNSDDIVWLRERTLGSGSYGKVDLFRSNKNVYADLAVKFPKKEISSEEVEEEIQMVEHFSTEKCENILQIGTLRDGDNKIIVMERLDGDLFDLDFKVIQDPLGTFVRFIRFISSGMKCALEQGYYFTDMKPDNIGWKECRDGVRFTFIDFGSFFKSDSDERVATWEISSKRKNHFSNAQVLIYATCITILMIKLKLISQDKFIEFENYMSKLSDSKKYPDVDYLIPTHYNKILKKFKKLDSEPILKELNIVIFSELKLLTRKISIGTNESHVSLFLEKLHNSVIDY